MSSNQSTVTKTLCENIVNMGPEQLPPEVLASVRELVLDALAVAVAGSAKMPAPAILAKSCMKKACSHDASVLGFGFRTSADQAAYVNAASMHALDYEPMWCPFNHAMSTTLPAALALAEEIGADGMALSLAVAKGLEMQGWIRQASRLFNLEKQRFHPPSSVGPLSSTVAASSLLDLDATQLRHALGVASSRCGGVMANNGTMTKCLHCANAAQTGVECARLAKMDFEADLNIFDHPMGYRLLFEEFVVEDLLKFGTQFRIIDPGYAIKLFPSCYATHWPIQCGLGFHGKFSAADVDHIRLTCARSHCNRPSPASGLEGKTSLQYTFSAAFLDGKVDMETFDEQRRWAPDMAGLLEKIVLEFDETVGGSWEESYCIAQAQLSDGTVHVARCDAPAGSWGGPPINRDVHLTKVRECLATRLETAAVEEVIALVGKLDTLDSSGLKYLVSLLSNSQEAMTESRKGVRGGS